ncbi:hypothetical protein [Streptomyces albireticuli]|uniref:Uncharacterized protein n=1 Tax=Streptomyces albireticuli TaxID=1940 RepID=A0A2A2D3H3_9ACTN|nr:hypothetical protein [Streptomyces albireticuli]MCD9195147.1 hypothetical protein [Streptomyces albireticuli]PAU47038.1 hypothetical protein CK936_20760 [Streptomyces albireticuli]
MREDVPRTAPIPVKPGKYQIHAHIIGPTSLLTATERAVKIVGSPYVIHLAYHQAAGLAFPRATPSGYVVFRAVPGSKAAVAAPSRLSATPQQRLGFDLS